MSNIIEAVYATHSIRIVEKSGEAWFVAKDVCAALDIIWDGSKTLGSIKDEWKGVGNFPTLKGDQSLIVISEPAVYRLAFRSNKEAAEKFADWVAGEVLPSIRKTGSYALKPMTPAEYLLYSAQMLVDAEKRSLALQSKLVQVEVKSDSASVRAEQAFQRAESNHGYFSVMGYARLCNIKVDWKEAAKHGGALTKLAKGLGSHIGSISDPRFGKVNTYSETLLDEYFGEMGWVRA
jgi:prophage antirepressor-like protein